MYIKLFLHFIFRVHCHYEQKFPQQVMKYPTTLLTSNYTCISLLTEELKSKPEDKQTLFTNYSFKYNYIYIYIIIIIDLMRVTSMQCFHSPVHFEWKEVKDQ